jgi:preprotein translocase subunit YajC
MKKFIDSAIVLLLIALIAPQKAFAQGTAGGSFASFFPLILIFVFFYLFLIRPQQKKTKEHQLLLNNLKKDDKVITSGGIFATVVSVKDNIVEVKIADGVNIQVSKPAIATVLMKKVEENTDTTTQQSSDIIKK